VSTSHIPGPSGGARLLTVPVYYKHVPMDINVVASGPHAYRSRGVPSHARKGEQLPVARFSLFFTGTPTDED
jgi:hypothetical protein